MLALIPDTGMRLSEALGIVWDDIQFEHEYPHINLVPYSWRPLKTSGNKRLIPLVSIAFKAVKISINSSLLPISCSHRTQMNPSVMATQLLQL